MKRFVTQQEIEQARQLDLLSYLQRYEPDELVRVSADVYSTKSHDSLKLSNGRWFWWSRGIGGVSALDYLVKVRDMDFVGTVQLLCDKKGYAPPAPTYTARPPVKKPFKLPPANENNDRVMAYLTARGISHKLIQLCIDRGLLYEDERHNCCFVGRDEANAAKYAMLRSSDQRSSFVLDVSGSDKRYSFSLPYNGSDTLYVFESAIDCLSFVDLQRNGQKSWKPDNYLSIAGVYQPRENIMDTPLPLALAKYLETYRQTAKIRLCLDADDAGRRAADTLIALLGDKYDITYEPPSIGKDYNDMLMAKRGISAATVRTRGAKDEVLR